MGTLFHVTVYASDLGGAQKAITAAFNRAAELDSKLSDYKPESELNLLCRAAPIRKVVSEDLYRVLDHAQGMARESEGAFDVTLGPLIRLWREARRLAKLPDPAAIEEARHRTGFRKLRLFPKGIVELTVRGMQLDLGGIAKGYAADEMLRILKEAGFSNVLVAASGDLAIGDPPPDRRGWRVKLAETGEVRELSNTGVSTSGDESQFVLIGGVRYSHVLDPATGIGLPSSATVSVIAPTAMEADARATAESVKRSRMPRSSR
jgi:FAD:protein FMN transferase